MSHPQSRRALPLLLLLACAPSVPAIDLSTRLAAGEVRAGKVEKATDLIGGPTATGAIGDYKLYNSKVAVIVEAPGPSDGYGMYGGDIIDADLIRPAGEPGRSAYGEALEIWDQRTYRATAIEVVNDGRDGKPAIVRTTGTDDRFPLIESILGESEGTLGVTVTVDYVLAPDSDTIQRIVRPTAGPDGLNISAHLAGFVMGDGLAMFLPGYGFDIPQVPGAAAPYFAGVSDDVSYTFLTDGQFTPVIQVQGFQLANLSSFGAGAGETTELNDWIVIGSGDVAAHEVRHRAILGALGARFDDVTQVSGKVVDASGAGVAGARVHAIQANGKYRLQTISKSDGAFTLALEPGDYRFIPTQGGADPGAAVAVTVGASAVTNVSLALPATGKVHLVAKEGSSGIPVKLQVIRNDAPAAPPASMGLGGRPLGRERVEFSPATGLTVELPPGAYKLIVSRGFEYSVAQQDVTVVAGQTVEVPVTLVREVDTAQWISGDYHVHSQRSADSDDLEGHKVLAAAAEGLELPITTEHEHIGDFGPAIAKQGLGAFVASVIGEEVSTTKLGHFNAFPLVRDPTQQNYGAIWWYGVKGDDLMKAMRANPGRPIVQVNHPRSGSFGAPFIKGYFSATGFDPATFSPRDPRDWSIDYDAIEISNGGPPGYEDWFAFLDRGHRVLATGDSDSHVARTDMVGYPRNYVRLGEDDPAKFQENSFVSALRGGRLSVSGGWFVELKLGAGLQGDVLTPAAIVSGVVPASVKVQGPSWLGAATGEVVVNGGVVATFEVPASESAVRVDRPFAVPVPEGKDAWVLVRVTGGRLDPVLPGASAFGFTNPVFLDGDGDGAFKGFRTDP